MRHAVVVVFHVEAEDTEAARDLVQHQLRLAEAGHELGPLSCDWEVGEAGEAPRPVMPV